MADTRKAFLAELAKHSPQMAKAFEESVQGIRSSAQLKALEAAIERGDVGAALQAINLGHEFFAPLDRAIDSAFYAGGVWQLSNLPKPKSTGSLGPLNIRFDGRHPLAEAWTRQAAGRLITEITRDAEKVIRETISEGIEANLGQRKIVQQLIGRAQGNQRAGGLIGLHSRQAAAVRRARQELVGLDARYFTRALRDKRFDGVVRKAIKDGRALSAADLDRITGRYSDRLLQARGKLIARTESNRAMNEGRAQGIGQLIERGEVPAEAVTKIWDATPGPRTRDTHRALNGQSVTWGRSFSSPSGASLRWPHDENAPAAETVNCRCSARFRVDWRRAGELRGTT